MEHIPKNSVALAGEFATLSQLALHGYDASVTLGNTKNIDILVFDPRTNKTYQIEVKTNRERRKGPTNSKFFGRMETSWQMHEKHERIIHPDLFYCFVHINIDGTKSPKNTFRYFIVPSAVVAEYVREEHRAWLKDKSTHRDSKRRTFRVGLATIRKIKVPAPLAEDYENRWDFKSKTKSKVR